MPDGIQENVTFKWRRGDSPETGGVVYKTLEFPS